VFLVYTDRFFVESGKYTMDNELNSGDKVIALAAAAMSAAILGGAIAGVLAGWIATHKISIAVIALIAGAIIGGILGIVVGKLIFPTSDGNVMVAKWGPSSLPLTLKGNIIACVVTSLVICLLAVLILKADILAIAVPSIGVSVFIAIALAMLASLI